MDAKAAAARNKQRLSAVWPTIPQEVEAFMKAHKMPENAIQWFNKVGYSMMFRLACFFFF
jgi:hypothetical protein